MSWGPARRTLNFNSHQWRAETITSVHFISVSLIGRGKYDSTAFITFTWKIICFLRKLSIRSRHKQQRKLRLNHFLTEPIFYQVLGNATSNKYKCFFFFLKNHDVYMLHLFLSLFADSLFLYWSECVALIHHLKIVFLSCSSAHPISELRMLQAIVKWKEQLT